MGVQYPLDEGATGSGSDQATLTLMEANYFVRKHVLRDVRPYMCMFEDCSRASRQFFYRLTFLEHLKHGHGFRKKLKQMTNCLFCNEALPVSYRGDLKQHARHIGRHMEEVAFSVLTKPYEDWDFYSDSSVADVTQQSVSSPAHENKLYEVEISQSTVLAAESRRLMYKCELKLSGEKCGVTFVEL